MEVMQPLWSHVSKRQPTQGRPNVQTTHCKDQNQSIFLLLGQLQAFEHWNRQNADQDVCDDIESGVGEPKCHQVETAPTLDRLVPEIGHWQAGDDASNECPSAVDTDDSKQYPASTSDFRSNEETKEL